jgi:hypothetical protein
MLYCYSKAIAAVSKYLNSNPVGNLSSIDPASPDEWRDHSEERRICANHIGDHCTIGAAST